MKRRTLLLGGATIAASTVLPALAMPAIQPIDTLAGFKDFIREYRKLYFYNFDNPDGETFEKLNIGLIERYPELFSNGYMTKPVELINDKRVVAVSRAYKTQYNQVLVQDLKAICGLDAEAELQNIIIEEAAAELRKIPERGGNPVFYIPIYMVKMVEPETFMPVVGFKTRYGDLNMPKTTNYAIQDKYPFPFPFKYTGRMI